MLGGVSDPPRARPVSLVERVATTALVPALVLLAERIPLAYVDAGAVARVKANVSPLGVGIAPFITAYALVELLALLVPRWRRARREARGRLRLERASGALALLLSVVQAYGVAMSLESSDLVVVAGLLPRIVHTASLVGGTCAAVLAARWVTRRGLVNGYVLLWAMPVVLDLLGGQAFRNAALQGAARDALLLGVALLVPVVATVVAVAAGDAVASVLPGEESAYRGGTPAAPRVHYAVPVSSIQPITVAGSLLMMPAVLAAWVPGMRDLSTLLQRGDVAFEVTYAAVLLLAMVVAAGLLHRSNEVVAFVRRLGAVSDEDARRDEGRAFRRAMIPTVAFLLVLVAASRAARGLSSGAPAMVALAIATAVAIDLGRSLAAHLRARDLVCVAEEHDAYAVAALRAALAAEGVDAKPRGMAVLSLLQAFAPYAPVGLYVRAGDAERATALLRHWAAGEAKPASPAPTGVASALGRAAASPVAKAAGLVGLAAMALAVGRLPRPERPPARRADVLLLRVDDEADPLKGIHEDDVPEGVSLYTEAVPVGPGHSQQHAYARIMPHDGESNGAAWSRVLPWLQTRALPDGDRWAWQDVTEPVAPEEQGGPMTFRVVGLRTIVLRGEPVVTTADVEDAVVTLDDNSGPGYPSVYVMVTLGSAGAERFYDVTREWNGRRLAILVDGHVDSAPVIKQPIRGGRISITMGAGDLDKQLADARQLAAGLR
jgi:hypothetical protein